MPRNTTAVSRGRPVTGVPAEHDELLERFMEAPTAGERALHALFLRRVLEVRRDRIEAGRTERAA